jgi:TonB family protein
MTFRPAFRALLTVACLPGLVAAQGTTGQKIQARPGDLILVENADRVRIVRRREGQVRAVFNPEQRTVTLLADFAASTRSIPDGRVDGTFKFMDVVGTWPLGTRWEGRASIEDYLVVEEHGNYSVGLGLRTPSGLIQLLAHTPQPFFNDPAAVATLSFLGGARGAGGSSFDEVEQADSAAPRKMTPPAGSPSGAAAPVRVGGNIRTPTKIHDVRPVYPEAALAARITGLVILEAVIGTDGSVTEARIIRSVPGLDDAAVDAVKQWRFEQTLLNGAAVPVIMTVTVSFNLK